ncbi:MAG: DUF503 domain-containing protein [Myxococcota bacterium]
MVVGVALVEIQVHGSQSLKQKRGVVRSISSRVRQRFNLAVAEVGGQGTWQRAVLGLTTLGNDGGTVRGVLDRAVRYVEELHLGEVTGSEVELLSLPLEE